VRDGWPVPVRLVFAGTPQAAVPPLQALLKADHHEVIAVLSRPHARSGRGRREVASPVEQVAADAGIPVLTPRRPSDPDFLDQLVELRPDCCPVVAYGALIPAAALAIPPHGWVNLHFSLLPAWRGAAPVQHAILHGDEITGASTFQIEAGLDTGPVYGVVTEEIRPTDTAGELLERLARSGADLLVATMQGISDGSLVPRPQRADGISVAAKITVDDARVDWAAPAVHVDRLVRACTPAPGAWTVFRGQRLKLGPLRVVSGDGLAPGELRTGKHSVLVGTATAPVELGDVHAPGKRPVPAADWARGARPNSGERLG
jgi:methionyl-tRNA formyltransferase